MHAPPATAPPQPTLSRATALAELVLPSAEDLTAACASHVPTEAGLLVHAGLSDAGILHGGEPLQKDTPRGAGELLSEALDQRLSPLQLTLPDSPVLKAIWLKSVANYERLCLQRRAKRLRLAHRREARGLVPIKEIQ